MYSKNMKGFVVLLSLFIIILGTVPRSCPGYELAFSTYFGGSGDVDQPRDIFVDNEANIYITGGTNSLDFPTTPGAYDRTFATGGTQIGSAGLMDVFVAKFDPNGQLIWSTYLGGPNYDRAYAIEVDSQGYVYIAGRAGPGFPVTSGAFQGSFQGYDAGIYGLQNAFVAKLSSDGSNLIWASYVGVGAGCRDLAIDRNSDVYVPLYYPNKGNSPPAEWFVNAFQKSPQGGIDCGVVKIKGDGSSVVWATWLGGSADDHGTASIRVDNNGYVYIATATESSDIPTTPGAHDRTYNGGVDCYVAELTSDGSDLVFGTYLGGSNNEWVSTHNLALGDNGNVYASTWTNSLNFPTTSGVVQRAFGSGSSDMAIAKFSSTGALLASTFIGGNGMENPDGIYVDDSGNVYISGQTSSTNFPVTSDAYQASNNGGKDAVWIKLSADFSHLLYCTYMGGSSDDDGRTGFLSQDGNIYIAGTTYSSDWPILNAFQDSLKGGGNDCVLAGLVLNGIDSNNNDGTQSETGSNSDGGGCFIATAAFGSYAEPHVKLLRDFRDQCLLTNTPGRWFVGMYYRYSPFWADLINIHTWCKPIIRLALVPLACIGYIMVKTSVEYTLIPAVFLFVASLLACSLCIRVSRR